MTILRSGPPKGYSENWAKAFGKKKTKTAAKKSKPAKASKAKAKAKKKSG